MTKVINQKITDKYALYHADCVHVASGLPDNSVGLSVYSPPFPTMYAYTNSAYDMGNVQTIDEMIGQYEFLQREMLRITMPGRNNLMHITQGVAQKGRDGYIGLKDFRGKIIDMMTRIGWDYYGEFTVDKDPQIKAMRTNDHGLMFGNLVKDAARMHMAMPDIVLQFRKPGENPEPIHAAAANRKYKDADGWVSDKEWILWARPVWYSQDYMPGTWRPDYQGDPCPGGIRETDVLNVRQARETNDERHLCPLQVGLIERIVKLWSNPDDVVFSPFAGIGSEGVVAVREGRKFVGAELKESYWRNAVRNIDNAIRESGAVTLFDLAAA